MAQPLAPTVSGDRVFTNGGYYGGGVYAFDATKGTQFWVRTAGDDDMSTPAIDSKYAYYYSGVGLEVYDVSNGVSVASIRDPKVWVPRGGHCASAGRSRGQPYSTS